MLFKKKTEETNKPKKGKLTIACYVIAVIFCVFFVLTMVNALVYIYSLLAAGSISLSSDFYDIILYVLNYTYAFIYLGIAFVIALFGYVIQLLTVKDEEVIEEVEETEEA